jgi:hypothetical protein
MSKETPKPFALNGTNNPVVKNWMGSGHDIYLDEFYFISYADQEKLIESHGISISDVKTLSKEEYLEAKKEIAKQLKEKFPEYFTIVSWVGVDQIKAREIAKLDPAKNPNYIRIIGRMLLEWAEEGFVPQFDTYFDKTRRLLMVPVQAWEHFHEWSYMLRKQGGWRNK